ncbi:MAG: hypothetical protein ABWZ53_12920 [Actinomycetota bacterium]
MAPTDAPDDPSTFHRCEPLLQEGHTLIDDSCAFQCSQTDPGDLPGGGDID